MACMVANAKILHSVIRGVVSVSRPTQGLVSDNLANVSVSGLNVSVSALRLSCTNRNFCYNYQTTTNNISKKKKKIERMHNTLAHVVRGPRLHSKIMPIAQVMLLILAGLCLDIDIYVHALINYSC
jgi:hypothetical protein